MTLCKESVERGSSLLQSAFDSLHPCQTVAMATAEGEVYSVDKSVTGG